MINKDIPRKIIDASKAEKMLDRIAYQVLEQNHNARELILMGVANRGYKLAEMIARRLEKISDIKITLTWVKVDKIDPVKSPVTLEHPEMSFKKKTIIIIDDVGNTGRTIYYAMQPIAKDLPKKIQAAVLVDRMHKSFPIHADFVGLSLATTLKDEVIVEFDEKDNVEGAYLY